MDEEVGDFIQDYCVHSKIDPDYEYDAVRFFDFTRPESVSEAQQAELWFESAGSCPPSPFIMKLKWKESISVQNANASPKSKDSQSTSSSSNILNVGMVPEVSVSDGSTNGQRSENDTGQDFLKAKTKCMAKSSIPRSSTLMKPTTSHLAKISQARQDHSGLLLGRFQRSFIKIDDRRLQNLLGVESQASKRQKLESGYLRKAAHLKHQTLLSHKIPKQVRPLDACSGQCRSKITVPREPELETAHRAQKQRYKDNSESGENAISNVHTFKARPLNRKILEAPSLPFPRKSTTQLPEFQVFRLKTLERAMHHSAADALDMHNSDSILQNGIADSKRQNHRDAFKHQKCKVLHKYKDCPLNKKIFSNKKDLNVLNNTKRESTDPREYKFSSKGLSQNPPMDLFKKLCLTSDCESNRISQSKPLLPTKDSKENAPDFFQKEHQGHRVKPYPCGSDWRLPEVGPQSNINR